MNATEDSAGAAPRKAAHFDGSCLGCLFVMMVPVAILAGIAAFDSGFAAILGSGDGRRNPFALIRIGPVDAGALLFAALAAREAWRAARRFLAGRAVWIEGDHLCFHPTVRARPLPLEAVEAIGYEEGDIATLVWITHGGGRRITVKMIDPETAEAFVAEAQRARAALTFG